MKIICDCGNEMGFVLDNDDMDEESTEMYGEYVKKDDSKFSFWAEHDETGMTCQKCNKSIWYFV